MDNPDAIVTNCNNFPLPPSPAMDECKSTLSSMPEGGLPWDMQHIDAHPEHGPLPPHSAAVY